MRLLHYPCRLLYDRNDVCMYTDSFDFHGTRKENTGALGTLKRVLLDRKSSDNARQQLTFDSSLIV